MPDNSSSTDTSISVVPVTAESCKPFLLEVMVFSPEAGFKFQVSVERSCESPTREIWKLVFDLFKKQATGTDFDQIVHVSYRAANDIQQKKIATTATKGLTPEQSDRLINRVHPAVKALANSDSLTPAQLDAKKARVKKEMSKTVDVVNIEV